MATFLAHLEDREDPDQECADYIKILPSTVSAKRGGRGRGEKRGEHAGNTNTKTNRLWKCDYCLCNCYSRWEPCGWACSSHDQEESEEEVLSFIVKEAEADLQPLQELRKSYNERINPRLRYTVA